MSDWKEQLAKDLYLETMDVAWTDDVIIQYALDFSKAIESKRSCGKCDEIDKELYQDTYCNIHEQYRAPDDYCNRFTPKKETVMQMPSGFDKTWLEVKKARFETALTKARNLNSRMKLFLKDAKQDYLSKAQINTLKETLFNGLENSDDT